MSGSSSGLPCLTVLGGPMAGTQVVLERSAESILIGSDASCRFCLPLPGVSPIHVRIWFDDSGVTVFDTHSPRGLYINDDRVNGQAPLRNGDILWLGTPGEDDVVMIQCKIPRAQATAAPTDASRETGDETMALGSPVGSGEAPPPTTIIESDFEDFEAPTQFIKAETEATVLEVVPEEPEHLHPEEATAFIAPEEKPTGAPDSFPSEDALSPTIVVGDVHHGSFEDETLAQAEPPAAQPTEDPLTRPFARPRELEEEHIASAPPLGAPTPPPPVAPPPAPTPRAPEPARPAPRTSAPRTAPTPAPSARPEPSRPAGASPQPPRRPAASKPPYAAIGAGLLLLLVGAGVFVVMKLRAPAAEPPPSPVATTLAPVATAPTPAPLPSPEPVAPTPVPSPTVEETVTIVKPAVPSPKVAAGPSPLAPSPTPAKPSPSPKTLPSPSPVKTPPVQTGPNPAEQTAAQVASLLGQAEAAVAAKKYPEAAGLYDQALKLDPQNQRASAGKASALGLAAGPRRAFASGKTSVTTKDAKADLTGFDSADVKVAKAPDYSGIIEFEVAPPGVKPGDNYTVRVIFTNDGKKSFKINSMTVSTVANGTRSGGPAAPRVRQVASQQKVTLEELPGVWGEGVNSWVMEVVVTSDRGDTFKNQLVWR